MFVFALYSSKYKEIKGTKLTGVTKFAWVIFSKRIL
jgi:hypothetical protein